MSLNQRLKNRHAKSNDGFLFDREQAESNVTSLLHLGSWKNIIIQNGYTKDSTKA